MAEIGITDVASTLQEQISSQIQSFLIQESVLMGTVTRIPAMPGMKSVELPILDGFSVADKTENVAASLQELTSTGDVLLLDKEKVVAFAIEQRAADQSVLNLEAAALERAAKAIALQIDTDIVAQLIQTSAAAPDHRLAYANFLTGNTLGQADLLAARVAMHQQNLKFSDCTIACSPASEGNLLQVENFVHVDKYGQNSATQNGEIGRLYGAPVVVTNSMADLQTVVYHPSHVALGEQRSMRIERDRDILKLADIFAIHCLYGTKVLDGGKRGVMLGTVA